MTAYHSVLVTDVRGTISGLDPRPLPITGEEEQVVQDMAEVARNISVKTADTPSLVIALGDSENDREMLEQADIAVVVMRPDGNHLIGVDALVRLLAASKVAHQLLDHRHARGAADQHNLVQIRRFELGVL